LSIVMCTLIFCFFFSSRRRHTRFSRDWSSDVCSSDLVIQGVDAFRLYDTFGYPLDLIELMARERGYAVDLAGFESALEEQRERSRVAHQARAAEGVDTSALAAGWEELVPDAEQEFVGYEATTVETDIVAYRREN